MDHTSHTTGNAKSDGALLGVLMVGSFLSHITMDAFVSGITGIGAAFYTVNQITIFIRNRKTSKNEGDSKKTK